MSMYDGSMLPYELPPPDLDAELGPAFSVTGAPPVTSGIGRARAGEVEEEAGSVEGGGGDLLVVRSLLLRLLSPPAPAAALARPSLLLDRDRGNSSWTAARTLWMDASMFGWSMLTQ